MNAVTPLHIDAHKRTATGIALLGKPRAAQDVLVFIKRYGGSFGPRYVVLVTPHGAEQGERYEVNERTLEALENGRTPEELELEPYEPEID